MRFKIKTLLARKSEWKKKTCKRNSKFYVKHSHRRFNVQIVNVMRVKRDFPWNLNNSLLLNAIVKNLQKVMAIREEFAGLFLNLSKGFLNLEKSGKIQNETTSIDQLKYKFSTSQEIKIIVTIIPLITFIIQTWLPITTLHTKNIHLDRNLSEVHSRHTKSN